MSLKFAVLAFLVGAALGDAQCSFQVNGKSVDFAGVVGAPLTILQSAVNTLPAATHTWQISLCESVPARATAGKCGRMGVQVPAYAFQFHENTGTECQQTFNKEISSWVWTGKEATRRLQTATDPAMEAVMHVTCGDSPMSVDGTATVSGAQCGSGGLCRWDVHLKSSKLCAAAGDRGGLGGGFWFLLILLLALVVYVAGMVTFNYVKREKRGVDLAPHPHFWKALPGLAKDGVFFAKDKGMGLAGRGDAGEYKNVT